MVVPVFESPTTPETAPSSFQKAITNFKGIGNSGTGGEKEMAAFAISEKDIPERFTDEILETFWDIDTKKKKTNNKQIKKKNKYFSQKKKKKIKNKKIKENKISSHTILLLHNPSLSRLLFFYCLVYLLLFQLSLLLSNRPSFKEVTERTKE
jgi:hypothetical protein